MTREEFNKLSQQEKLNLVGDKWFSVYKNEEYGWVIERSYCTDASGKKRLLYENKCMSITLPFKKYFKDLDVHLGLDNKSYNYLVYYKKGKITFRIGNIPSDFLEESYFMEIPKSSINEYIDGSVLENFKPFEKEYTDYRDIEEIRNKETKLIDILPKQQKNTWFDNLNSQTKINIGIISVAVLITIINVITRIC